MANTPILSMEFGIAPIAVVLKALPLGGEKVHLATSPSVERVANIGIDTEDPGLWNTPLIPTFTTVSGEKWNFQNR